MERALTDEDILSFLRVNKRKYASQIELLQAAAQLLWPHGPPADAGMRIARLALQEANRSSSRPAPAGGSPRRRTDPLGTGRLPQTSPLG